MSKITILLVEDHLIVRDGLRALLRLQSDMEIVGEADNGRLAVTLAASLSPQVIIMDMAMPLLNGMQAIRQILKAQPEIKVLVLSAYSDDEYVEQVMALGAAGYLNKRSGAQALPTAIRRIVQNQICFSDGISARRKSHADKIHARGDLPNPKSALLSPREMEVLQLIAEGKANKETSVELLICVKTVEKHRQSLMDKLDIHETAGLTRYAIATGIIESRAQAISR